MTKKTEMIIVLLLVLNPLVLNSQDIVWKQEFQAMYNGKISCAYSGGFFSAKPAMVDIDADGDLDLFVGESTNTLTFLRNDGTANQPLWVMIDDDYSDASGTFLAPVFCDIDDDGDSDFFYGGWNGEVRFWRNDGNASSPEWTKVSEKFLDLRFDSHAIPTFCDIDNDGDFDLFVGQGIGRINFFRNDGTAQSYQFVLADTQFANINTVGTIAPVFVDIDNDSDYDLFIGDKYVVQFYRNTGTASSPTWVEESTQYAGIVGKYFMTPIFPDIDGDGDLDMIVGDDHKGLSFYENIGTPENESWEHVTDHYATIDVGYTTFPDFADLDGDSDLDIYFGGNSHNGLIQVLNGGTAEIPAWTCNGDALVQGGKVPAFCDIDNDGDLDIFMSYGSGSIIFYENQGTATVANLAAPIMDYNSINLGDFASPTLCDIDDDQDFDLFIGREDGKISYYKNEGDASSPTWAEPDHFYNNIKMSSIRSTPTFCDLDNDGDYDLFVGDYTGRISYYQNDGTATAPVFKLVTTQYASILIEGHIRPVFADIDNDSDPDLFAGGPDGGIFLWKNMGASTDINESNSNFSVPLKFELNQNYPNPFNPSTTIRFSLQKSCFVTLKVFDLLGKEIQTIVKGKRPAGEHEVMWIPEGLPSGIYLYRLVAGDFVETRKLILQR